MHGGRGRGGGGGGGGGKGAGGKGGRPSLKFTFYSSFTAGLQKTGRALLLLLLLLEGEWDR